MTLTNCCSAPFWMETDLCSACKEHADEQEEHDCCQSKENGFPCTCIKPSFASCQQAEDDGQGDYEREREIEREALARHDNYFCEDCE